MTQAHIDALKSNRSKTFIGGNGECIGVNHSQFALKEIIYSEKYGELATRSIANEKIASRLMHFAIVPLIAHFEDSRMSYCIPSFGSKEFECNARLVDFGFARELKEGTTSMETRVYNFSDGYFPKEKITIPTMRHDVYNFGVVIREVVTALPPLPLPGEKTTHTLRTLSEFSSSIFEFLLKDDKVPNIARYIWKVSEECIKEEFRSSEEIHKRMECIIQQHWGSFKRWSPAETQSPKCEICLVNPFEESGCRYLKHSKSCREHINVCIACMRNSYFNPIKCHSCDKERIDPFIGVGWGAVFVAGYDSNPEIAEAFKKDVEDMRSCMTSVSLPVMCISEEKTEVIEPSTCGNDEKATIKAALKRIVAQDIETLVFYYSGHHGKDGFCLNNRTTMHIVDIGNAISDIFNERQKSRKGRKVENNEMTLRVLLFLDCCMPRELDIKDNQNIKIIQFNACADTEEAIVEKKESIFTKFVIQAFTKKASSKMCKSEKCQKREECGINGSFVTMDALLRYVDTHISYNVVQSGSCPHVICKRALDSKDVIIGYNYDFKMEFAFTPYHVDIHGQRSTLKTVTLSPDDFETMEDVKKKLAPSFYGKYMNTSTEVLTSELTLKEVIPDLLSIEISMGPRRTQKEEVCTVEQLLAAWNGKRQLEVIPRSIEDIAPDKPVGVVVHNGGSLRDNLIRLVKENRLKAHFDEMSEHWTSFAVNGEDVKELMNTLPSDSEAFFKAIKTICEIQPDRRWTRVLWKFRKDGHWQPIVILEVELGQ
ncbi:hypothetical protein MAR_009375 [Mya arenaria]|uniref:Protein kinase domain-containing protein n=1 Tax=Mya arenaria TaxID=6604 RepID=A0ABY7E1X9_MYAAR|nr:hypothetical protein MAR_009375 [Mya arenaria]